MFDTEVLAILAAALDPDGTRWAGGRGSTTTLPSSLDWAVEDFLFAEVPKTTIKRPRIAPQVAVKTIARAATVVMWATAEVLGHDLDELDPREVAERIREIHRKRLGGNNEN